MYTHQGRVQATPQRGDASPWGGGGGGGGGGGVSVKSNPAP